MGIHLKRTPAVIGRDEAATNRTPAAGLECQRSVEKVIHAFFPTEKRRFCPSAADSPPDRAAQQAVYPHQDALEPVLPVTPVGP